MKNINSTRFSHLTNEQKAYLAGFIDCDGSLMAQIVRKPDYAYKFQIRVTIQLSQRTSRIHFLKEIASEVGYGYVVSRNNMSDYVITQANIVYELLSLLLPYLRMKVKQANLILKIIQELPSAKVSKDKFIELCILANQVSILNTPNKILKNTWQVVKAELESEDLQ
uniref:Homing endonuclease n=1 Tax=Haematococcus lacustris TaxID=44745 RepID=Q8SMI7_HAELA|nr:homing endonuclease [Haematococcus lacustris]YP_009463671.1 homing endonuclease [Haematococcus lacustris]AAL77526.1 unknown [Haematococcus lacustris]ALO21604.1 putative LAGLIDADG homing endonuclease [Haematococcus lacustris]AUW36422.1 homing endonuclease [Haematococcus lacustris]AUW36493.1 homing endonuclease [Haematococcus lacustris]